MAEPMNNIWRGGVQHTTSESLEVVNAAIDTLPGAIVDAQGAAKTAFDGAPFYIVQEQLYGTVNDEQKGSARLLIPRSGTLFAVRAIAGQTIVRDAPLEISGAAGYVAVATAPVIGTTLFAEVDVTGVTTAGQLIPVRVK